MLYARDLCITNVPELVEIDEINCKHYDLNQFVDENSNIT